MAAKKTRSKKSASRAHASGGKKRKQELLRTQFMADFTKAFIGDPKKIHVLGWPDPTRLWPATGQNKTNILADYQTFVNVLMTVGYVGGPPPAAVPGSLGDRIGQFLIAEKWPSLTPISQKWVKEFGRPTVHLLEIAVILDRLLQAINSLHFYSGAPGGGPGGWPPH
jgi:hypothetical protein